MIVEDVADAISLTAKLMELHNENEFKVKSLNAAAFKLNKAQIDIYNTPEAELEKIEGFGKSIVAKIIEYKNTGSTAELNDLLARTPLGVVEMLDIKGIGPKKVGQLWRELEVESIGELLYACNENRLVELKGFGAKTQESIKKSIEFKESNSGKFHYSTVETFAANLIDALREKYADAQICLTGEIYRKCEIIETIDILTDTKLDLTGLPKEVEVKVKIHKCEANEFYYKLLETSATEEHLKAIGFFDLDEVEFESEEEIYERLGLQYIDPELREGLHEVELAEKSAIPALIELSDLKGCLHNHSKYSDGVNSLKEMAVYCKNMGLEYFGICDHSQSAFYAQGMKPETVMAQQKEIDALNIELAPFKIFKGIESDILNNGDLDYTEDVLKSFDFIVASVHSNLKMDEEKATARLIKAVENPYTTILGHPTGRLLLARPGYPINHKKVIDACAANNVVIELNAHPYRLDIDWRWINYCIQKNVMISINPDAHAVKGFHDMHFGVCAARKGMLSKEFCFNALSLHEITEWFNRKRNL